MDSDLRIKWKELWQGCEGSVYQSVEWIEALEMAGKKIKFFIVESSGKLSAGAAFFESEIRIFGFRRKILSTYGLPLCLDNKSGEEILRNIKRERKYFYATIAPNSTDNESNIFGSSGFGQVRNSTIIIDLSKSEKELFDLLEKKSIRWGIKTAEKNKLEFIEMKYSHDLDKFYEIYGNTAKDGGFPAEKKEFISFICKTGMGKLFLVRSSEKIVAGGMILMDKNKKMSILDLTASSEEGLKLQAMPFLYWRIILYSKSAGMDNFDLGGYDSEAKKGDKTYNINKYKERFGGRVIEQKIFCSNWRYGFVRKIMKRFMFIKKIYRKD